MTELEEKEAATARARKLLLGAEGAAAGGAAGATITLLSVLGISGLSSIVPIVGTSLGAIVGVAVASIIANKMKPAGTGGTPQQAASAAGDQAEQAGSRKS